MPRNLSFFGASYRPSSGNRGQPRLLGPEIEQHLVYFIGERSMMHLEEIRFEVLLVASLWVSEATIWRTLTRIEFTRKRVQHEALQPDKKLRAMWYNMVRSWRAE